MYFVVNKIVFANAYSRKTIVYTLSSSFPSTPLLSSPSALASLSVRLHHSLSTTLMTSSSVPMNSDTVKTRKGEPHNSLVCFLSLGKAIE